MSKKESVVKLGIVGGQRGGYFADSVRSFAGKIELTAICDLDESVLAKWKAINPDLELFTSYTEMLEKSSCNAVFIATPMLLHASMAVQALKAGKHVVSEVIAAATMEECWELVEAVEKSGLPYMLAENYCYMRPNRMVLNMAQQGVFGRMTYAEGAYIHDCRSLLYDKAGNITWRGEKRRTIKGNSYPTHSLGPVSQWLGINKPNGDKLVSVAGFMTASASTAPYVAELLGKDHPDAKPEGWGMGDSASCIIQTANQAVINIRVDWSSARPHNMPHYALQGTKASYLSARYEKEDPLIWIDGVSPGKSPAGDAEWEPLWKYADRYEHPDWKLEGAKAESSGHGGGDYFILRDFAKAVVDGEKPAIDVYDAVTWSCVMPLSIQSIASGNKVLEIPTFNRKV